MTQTSQSKEIMKAEIFSIGNEITNGDIVNTNARYISNKLKQIGIDVIAHRSIRDNRNEILDAFDNAFLRADIIITTGGLGPTVDDMTKECACEYFNKKLIVHDESLVKLKSFFKTLCREMPVNNIKQAMFPEDAFILKNDKGTAPGAVLTSGNKKIAMLPGPPSEMIYMFDNYLYSYLQGLSDSVFSAKTIKFAGIGEGAMDEMLKDILNEDGNPKAAPYAKDSYCQVTITAHAATKKEADSKLEILENEIQQRMNEYVFGFDDDEMETVTAEKLIEKRLSVVTAESCTGGIIAGRLINFPGASSFFKEGYITYSNESKQSILNVNADTIMKYGAVSEQVVAEMLDGALEKSGSNIAIAVSGIAGPDGGTLEKPVGLVYAGIKHLNHVEIKRLNLSGSRNRIRERAAFTVIDMLRRYLNTI